MSTADAIEHIVLWSERMDTRTAVALARLATGLRERERQAATRAPRKCGLCQQRHPKALGCAP